ncbi:probable glutathione S-transferase [Henckelia pumila]|uniref:probable glutathione S-transferase n=1 Tax=Henckelia pumila TaxID=405737 RepID=UPI003C6E695A
MGAETEGVEYEFIQEDLSNKSPLLLESNPVHKKVPVLIHNGKSIAESLVILEYIDKTWENVPPILPKCPYDRAVARFWARFLDEKCLPVIRTACSVSGEEQAKAKEEVEESLKILDNELKGKKFFGGDVIGFVEIAGNFLAFWSVVIAELVGLEIITKEKFPNVCRWKDEYVNSSSVKEHLPHRKKLVESFRAHFQKIK